MDNRNSYIIVLIYRQTYVSVIFLAGIATLEYFSQIRASVG